MTRIKNKFRGFHASRYSREPLEKIFAEVWQEINDEKLNHNTIIDYLFNQSSDQRYVEKRPEYEYVFASTIIQWLGSPVGQGFLQRIIKKAKRKSIWLPMLDKGE